MPCYSTTADNDRALWAGKLSSALSAMVLGRKASRDADDVDTLQLRARAVASLPVFHGPRDRRLKRWSGTRLKGSSTDATGVP